MFLKEKRDGTIKAQGCTDGQHLRLTVSIEAMMLLCTIDAKESRYIVVSDRTGAFLHADRNDNVNMLLEGTIA